MSLLSQESIFFPISVLVEFFSYCWIHIPLLIIKAKLQNYGRVTVRIKAKFSKAFSFTKQMSVLELLLKQNKWTYTGTCVINSYREIHWRNVISEASKIINSPKPLPVPSQIIPCNSDDEYICMTLFSNIIYAKTVKTSSRLKADSLVKIMP